MEVSCFFLELRNRLNRTAGGSRTERWTYAGSNEILCGVPGTIACRETTLVECSGFCIEFADSGTQPSSKPGIAVLGHRQCCLWSVVIIEESYASIGWKRALRIPGRIKRSYKFAFYERESHVIYPQWSVKRSVQA